ncbi:MAG: TIGR02221 family CRISPR-associated protein [Lachnospiraceae bacterium]|nr:TIGR02221 family CRISPR-associated protein [Lachnospiraceae bacterium]
MEIFSSDQFCYRKAIYCTPEAAGERLEIESEFVAKPLVLLEKPKQIFIIGTVKSSWSSFYNKFAGNRDFEHFYTLFEIETANGKDTGNERLCEITAIIEKIYKNDKVLQSLYSADEPPVELHILLTKYGLNEAELKDNYKIISSMEKYFQKDRQYQISFDITHSFRSIPIYDLVILNYLKHITQYHVEISHVYYGNVEVSGEAGKAYIVDLKDLISVLELTNGVGEFRDTGNAVALLHELSDSESALGTALERFDWATQINDYQAIINSVEGLLRLVNTPETKSRYTDLKDMLARVLEEQFISEEKLLELKESSTYPDHVGELQLCICKWFRNQNRYGLAIATALETLRSFLVPFYLRRNGGLNDEITLTDCQNENKRKSAEDVLTHLSGFIKSGEMKADSEELKLLCTVADLRDQVRPIRNRFAHNLMSAQDKTTGDERMSERNETDEYLNDKKLIDEFISALDRLFALPKGKIAKAYYKKPAKKMTRKISSNKEMRLIICNADSYDNKYKKLLEYRFLKKSNKNSFDVYVLPEQLSRMISSRTKQEEVILDAFLVRQYIEEHFETEHLTVILDDLRYLQCVFYPAVLMRQNIDVNLLQYNQKNKQKTLQIISSSYELELEYDEMEQRAAEEYVSAEWTHETWELLHKSYASDSEWSIKIKEGEHIRYSPLPMNH